MVVTQHHTEVVVIGAGLAGLTAATELRRYVPVAVLEARNRVGGRILSSEMGGIIAELGAQWISSKHRRMAALLERFDLSTAPVRSSGAAFYELLGRRTVTHSAIPPVPLPSLLDLRRVKRKLAVLAKHIDPAAPWSSPKAKSMDERTLVTWLNRVSFSTYGRALFRILAEEQLCGELSETSVLDAVWSVASCGGVDAMLEAEERWTPEGLQKLPERMAAAMGDEVSLNAPVRRIDWTKDRVAVHTDRGTWHGRRVIVAIPPTLAGRIQYEPPLPYFRDQLTQRAGQGSVIKVALAYDKPFWRERGLSGEAFLDRGPVRYAMDSTPPGRGEGVLAVLSTGSDARLLGLGDERERRAAVLRGLAEAFGPEALAPSAYLEKDWMSDPWSRGGYGVNFSPGVLTEYGHALSTPVGPIHWAGTETASSWRLYMEGAVQSGERAAVEVAGALGLAAPDEA